MRPQLEGFGPRETGPPSNPSLVRLPELMQLGGQIAFHFFVGFARAFTRGVAL